MTDEPIDLDHHRGLAAQEAARSRRLLKEVEANEKVLRTQRDELEAHLFAPPAGNWREAAEKVRYILGLYAASLGIGDTQRRSLIDAVLADFERLDSESHPRPPA